MWPTGARTHPQDARHERRLGHICLTAQGEYSHYHSYFLLLFPIFLKSPWKVTKIMVDCRACYHHGTLVWEKQQRQESLSELPHPLALPRHAKNWERTSWHALKLSYDPHGRMCLLHRSVEKPSLWRHEDADHSGQTDLAKLLQPVHTLLVCSHTSPDSLFLSNPCMETQHWEEEADTKFYP